MEKRKSKAGRDVLPDVLKGFGIVLVVLGHCIQESYNGAGMDGFAFFDDRLYQFIYSFHMPLFMLVSGYYAWNSVQRAKTLQQRRKMIVKKCVYLITPIVVWKFFDFLYWSATGEYVYRGAGLFLIEFVTAALASYWFLWAVLSAFLLVCLMHYKFHDSIGLYVLVFMAMFFTPDGLGLMACKFVLPYYLIGFYVNKNKGVLLERISAPGKERGRMWCALLVSSLLFFGMIPFYNADCFVYLTGYKLIGKDYLAQLRIDLYRFAIGLCGTVFWVLFWGILLQFRRWWEHGVRLLACLGSRSMGIYVVAGIPAKLLDFGLAVDGAPVYGINLLQTVFVLFGSLVIVEVLGRIRGVRVIVGQ